MQFIAIEHLSKMLEQLFAVVVTMPEHFAVVLLQSNPVSAMLSSLFSLRQISSEFEPHVLKLKGVWMGSRHLKFVNIHELV